jgi:hypothetical protein
MVDGLAVSFRSEQRNADTDEWLGTTQVTGLRIDPDLSEVAFDLADLAHQEEPADQEESADRGAGGAR